MLSRKNHLLAH